MDCGQHSALALDAEWPVAFRMCMLKHSWHALHIQQNGISSRAWAWPHVEQYTALALFHSLYFVWGIMKISIFVECVRCTHENAIQLCELCGLSPVVIRLRKSWRALSLSLFLYDKSGDREPHGKVAAPRAFVWQQQIFGRVNNSIKHKLAGCAFMCICENCTRFSLLLRHSWNDSEILIKFIYACFCCILLMMMMMMEIDKGILNCLYNYCAFWLFGTSIIRVLRNSVATACAAHEQTSECVCVISLATRIHFESRNIPCYMSILHCNLGQYVEKGEKAFICLIDKAFLPTLNSSRAKMKLSWRIKIRC